MKRVTIILGTTLFAASCASFSISQAPQGPSAEETAAEQQAKAEREREAQAKAKASFDAAYAKLNKMMGSIKTSTPTPENLDAAKGDLMIVKAMLTSSTAWGPVTPELASFTLEAKGRLGEYKTLIEARSLQVEVFQYKTQLVELVGQLKQGVQGLKTSTQALSLITTLDSGFKAFDKLKVSDAQLVAKSKPLRDFMATMDGRVTSLKDAFQASRDEVYVAALTDELKKSTKALRTSLATLKANPRKADNFERVQKHLETHKSILASARKTKEYETQLKAPLKLADSVASLSEQQLTKFKLVYDVAAQKRKVQAAIKALKSATASFETATDDAVFDRAETALKKVEALLVQGKDLESKDKAYAGYARGVQSGMNRGRTGIKLERAKWPVRKQTNVLKGAAAAVAKAVQTVEKTPSEEAIKALETALTKINEALAAGKALESKDLTYLRLAIAERKNIKKAEGQIKKGQKKLVFTERKNLVNSAAKIAQTKVKEAKTEEALVDAEKAIAAVSSELVAGKTLESKDLDYLKFANATRKSVTELNKKIASARKGLAVDAQKLKVEKATEAMKLAAGQATDEASVTAAEKSIQEVERVLSSGKKLEAASPKYLKYVNAQRSSIEKVKKSVSAVRLKNQDTSARLAIEKAFANVESAAEAKDHKATLAAIAELDKALSANKNLESKSKSYKTFAVEKRKGLTKQKKAFAATQKKEAVDAAKLGIEKAFAEAEAAVASAADETSFKAADKAITQAENEISSHVSVEKIAPDYLKYAKAKRAGVAKFKKTIASARQKAKEDAAKIAVEQALANAMSTVSSATDATGFTAASTSIGALQKALNDNKALEASSKSYKKFATAQRQAIAAQKKTVAKAKKRARVEAASVAVEQAKANLQSQIASASTEAGFESAKTGVKALEEAIATHKAVEAESPKYAKLAKTARAYVPESKKAIKKAKITAKVNAAKLKIEQAQANAEGQVAGAADETGFAAAEKAVASFVASLNGQKSLSEKSKAFTKYLKKQRALVSKYNNTIASGRHNVKVQASRITLETNKAKLDEAVSVAADDAGFTAASKSIDALQQSLQGQAKLAKKDKEFGVYVAGLKKEIAASRKAIKRRQQAAKVDAHRIKLEQAKAEAETQVEGLSAESSQQAYQTAANAVSDFRKELEEGMFLGDASPKYAKYLAKMERVKNRLRAQIPRRRIEVAKRNAEIKLTQMASGTETGLFDAASEAVDKFASITKANKTFSGAGPEYKKFIKAMTAEARALRKSLVGQRFTMANTAIVTSLAALEAQPESEAYSPVERAIRKMDSLLREYSSTKSKSVKTLVKKHQSLVAKTKTKLVKFRVEGTKKRASLLIKTLDSSSVVADFLESKEVLGDLADVIEEAQGENDSNKKLEAYLAKAEKQSKKLRRLMESKKVTAQLQPEMEKIAVAVAKAKEQVDMIASEDATPEMLKVAATAIDEAETAVFDASKHDSKSVSFAKKRAKNQKKLNKLKLTIKKQERRAAKRAHQIAVEQAMGETETKLAAVEGSLDVKVLDAAIQSIRSARGVIREGKKFKSNKKYAKFLAARKTKLTAYRKGAVSTFLRSSREQMDAQVGALAVNSDLQAFQTAQASIQSYSEALDKLSEQFSESKGIKKTLAKARKRIPGNEAKIMNMRVAAAKSAAATQMEILREAKTADAVDMARATNDVLEKTVRGLRSASKKAKKNKKLKKLLGTVKANRKEIARYDFALKTKPHRKQIKAATETAKASLEVLKAGSMDDAAFREAEQAVEALATVVNNVPVMARGSKKYEKSLKAVRKRVRSYRVKIAKYRNSGKIKIHKAQVAEAKAAAKRAVKALSRTTEAEAYQSAETAIMELGRIVRDGEELAERDRKYAKYLSAARKLQPKLRSQVTAQRLSGAFRTASKSLKSLKKSPNKEKIEKATRAIEEAAKAVKVVESYGKPSKKAKKEIKAAKKKVRRYRVSLAQAQTKARFKLLTADSEPEDFLAAEEAIDSLRRLIKKNKKYAKKDKKMKKLLAKAKKDIPKYRVRIKKRQIEVAIKQAKENLAEAKSDPQAIALYEADEAISDLEEAVSSAKKLGKKNKKFGKFLRGAKKKAKKYRKVLVRVRLQKGSATGR